MKKIVIPFALIAFCACSSPSDNKLTEAIVSDSVSVQVTDSMPVDAMSAATSKPNGVSFNGTLVIPPQHYATVTLTMDGTVKSTSLLPGSYVKKGAVLATLENPDFISLQQTYLDAHAQLEYLESEYKRQQNLSQEQAASQKKLQQSKADYLSMKSRLQAAAAQLAILGVNPVELLAEGIRPYLTVQAPIEGYVNNVQMNLGKHLAAGETLCEVINKGQTLLRLVAYEKDLVNISLGNPVEFMVNGIGSKRFSAKLISIGQHVDEVSRSLEVYALVSESDPLFRPGMYVTAQIKYATKQ